MLTVTIFLFSLCFIVEVSEKHSELSSRGTRLRAILPDENLFLLIVKYPLDNTLDQSDDDVTDSTVS